jgi:hypothetical protein
MKKGKQVYKCVLDFNFNHSRDAVSIVNMYNCNLVYVYIQYVHNANKRTYCTHKQSVHIKHEKAADSLGVS